MLVGLPTGELDRTAIESAGEAASEASEAVADLNGSVEYKRNLVRVLVKRCVDEILS